MFTTPFFIFFMFFVIIVFGCIKREWRILYLTVAGFIFVFYLDAYAGIILIIMSLITYISGQGIMLLRQNKHERSTKSLFICVLCLYVILFFAYKFGLSVLNLTEYHDKINVAIADYLVIPLGFSFYTFQAISYLADIYTSKYHANEDLSEFMLYMNFFPKFLSGPIEKAGNFFSQSENIKKCKLWQSGRLSIAFSYILYGYFMKIVIADRVAFTVNQIFSCPQEYDSFFLLLGVILYTIQIYTDFAGYSYIALGIAKIFGIDIQLNFRNPYFSSGISEFWRKWHISLSNWLKDYIYIPLGGNRKGIIRKNINVLIVFVICGLWHGYGWSFIAWGLLHGIYSVADNLFLYKNKNKVLGNVIVLLEVSFAWIFFKATSVSGALNYIRQILVQGTNLNRIIENSQKLNLNPTEISVMFFSIILLITADGWANRHEKVFPEALQDKPRIFRYCIFYTLLISIYIFGIYGSGYHSENFIYMQF